MAKHRYANLSERERVFSDLSRVGRTHSDIVESTRLPGALVTSALRALNRQGRATHYGVCPVRWALPQTPIQQEVKE